MIKKIEYHATDGAGGRSVARFEHSHDIRRTGIERVDA